MKHIIAVLLAAGFLACSGTDEELGSEAAALTAHPSINFGFGITLTAGEECKTQTYDLSSPTTFAYSSTTCSD